MAQQRNEKGQFVKGVSGNPATQFNGGTAVEMQSRSAAARKENRSLAEVLRRELEKKASAGSPLTKMEWLVAKALDNHSKGSLTLKDLRYMQQLLGEDTININHTVAPIDIAVSSAQVADDIRRVIDAGAQPAPPKDEA